MGHRAAVNVVDFDEQYIVSASGDRTIKVRRRERERERKSKRIELKIVVFCSLRYGKPVIVNLCVLFMGTEEE